MTDTTMRELNSANTYKGSEQGGGTRVVGFYMVCNGGKYGKAN